MRSRVLQVQDGTIHIEPIDPGRHRVSFEPSGPSIFVPRSEVETGFPLALLSELAAERGNSWICEEIARHESPGYVLGAIRRQIESHFQPADFAGKRVLDFGCGSGASTFGLAEMLPRAEIVGVELDEGNVRTARMVSKYKRLANASFACSPHGEALPGGIGKFDIVMLSAVWEHLLPVERPTVARLVWDVLNIGGALLINQTPYRWAPHEHHTTGLWGINYLPDSLALRVARRFSRESTAEIARCDWQQLLRRGIRGGTEMEIKMCIRRAGGKSRVVQPRPPFLDRADYWLQATSQRRRWVKRILANVFSATDRILGTMPVTHVDLVLEKVC
jgi:SAM-dependent methyltransferase